jgi:superfamily II DNA or RNA helicase
LQNNTKLSQLTRTAFVAFHSSLILDIRESLMEIKDGNDVAVAPIDPTFELRSYQAEMVEASMKDNIIVVMDTGSGKTHMQVYSMR